MFKKFFFLFCLLVSIFEFISCEVGLGSSVDTEPPKVSITYPPAMSVICGKFTLAGTCSDDQGVKVISISVVDSEGKSISGYGINDITPNKNGKTWSVDVNIPVSNVFPLEDGKYTFNVSAKDSSDRVSGTSSRAFEIDNTAPFFIISSPAVTDVSNATEYGSVFKISGKIADDHDVRAVNVNVFDSNENAISGNSSWKLLNIDTAGGTSLTVARYFSNTKDISEDNLLLHNRYTGIYGEDTEGEKVFTCSIELEDCARSYVSPVYDDSEVVNTTSGNTTSTLWLNDDIYDELMGSKSAYQLEAGDLKKIWNGSIDNQEVFDILKNKITETSTKKLAFSLNKNASPFYNIAGYVIDGVDFGTNKAAKQGKVTFQVQAGRDGTLLKPETFVLYLFGPLESSIVTNDFVSQIYSNPAEKYELLHKDSDSQAEIIFSDKDYAKGSVSSFTQSVELPNAISKNEKYVFVASGEDADGLELETSDGVFYGFVGESAGFAPSVEISSPVEDDIISLQTLSSLVITGNTSSDESKIKEITYSVDVYNQLSVQNGSYEKVGTITGSGTATSGFLGVDKKINFSCDLSKGTGWSSCKPISGQMFIYNISITVTDDSNLYTTRSQKLYVDCLLPEPIIQSVEVIADNSVVPNLINGIVNVVGKVTEKNLKKLKLSVSDGTTTINFPSDDSSLESSFEQKVDTSAFEDEKNLTLTLIATDEAGNEKSVESIYKIQQESDRPVISDTDSLKNSSTLGNAWDNVKNGVNLFGVKQNNNLSISVVDDDGISKVIISVYDKDEKLIGSTGAVSILKAILENKTDGSAENPKTYTTGNISYRLPATEGKYRIDVEAFDSEYDNGTTLTKAFRSVKKSYYIIVNENNLVMRLLGVNDDSDNIKASEDYDVKGTLTLTDTNQLSSIMCYEMKEICSKCNNDIDSCDCNGGPTKIWIKTGNPISKYKTVLQQDETNSISVSIVDSKISWSDKILASYIGDGSSGNSEKHFYYEANDVYGNTSAVELTCNVDGICPEVNILTTGFDTWKKSSTQKLEVVSCDNSTSFNSGVSKVYYYKNSPENSVEMTAEYLCDKNGNKSSSGLYRKYSTTIDGISDGDSNNIYFYATDVVGNSSSPLGVILKIDTICPNISSFAINESKKVFQNTKSLNLSYTVSDDTSKVKQLLFSTDSGFKNSVTVTDFSNGSYSYALTGLNDGTYNVYLKAIDNAGNESEISKTGEFIVDTTAPSVKISSPVTQDNVKTTVNKKVKFSGTVNDNNLEATSIPKIYFKKTNGSWVVCTVENPKLTGQEWSCTVDTFVNDINNTDTACEVEFRCAFTDLAGNETTSDYSDSVVLLNVNQLSDIPEIKFTNINVTGSSTSSKKITGVISDDDDICSELWKIDAASFDEDKLQTVSEANGWTKFNIESGTGIFSVELGNSEKEGSKEWVLCVVDLEGTKFSSKSSKQLEKPYISDSVNEKSQLEKISFSYDITPPVPTLYVAHSENGLLGTDLNSTYGPNDKIYLKVSVKESVGMKVANPVSVVFNGNTYGANSEPIHENDIYTYSFNPINLSTAIPEGNNQISVVATDSADQNNKTVGTIIFDKTAPFVQIISPTTDMSDAVTGAATIKGIVSDDYSSVSKMYYAFPMTGKTDSELEWKEVNVSTSWEIKFASGAEESSDSLLYYVNSKEIDESFTYVFENSGTENIYKLPIYFKVTDSAGNTEIRKTYTSDVGENPLYVLVDSEGGKPKAWITSPEPNTTTSGIVTIYGGASDDVSVSSVSVRYCFADTNIIPETLEWNYSASVSGTNSWKYSIDTTGKKFVFVSCKATDNENKSRDWTKANLINIDSNSPVIKNIKVVQYSGDVPDSSTLVSELDYSSGMYISNVSCAANSSWYLVADISDLTDSGSAGTVASITFSALSSSTGNEIYLDESAISEKNPNTETYKLKVPLKTSDGSNGLSGQIYYKIKVSDGNSYSETSIKINVDSTAPSLYNTNNKESTNVSNLLRLKSNSTVIGNTDSLAKVENSNNFFTFGDTVGEAGSGLEYIAISFVRNNVISDSDDKNRVYNPMKTGGYTGESISKSVISSSKTSGNVYINSDNLPSLYYSNVTRNSEDSVTLGSVNTNIRKGGLVKIAGSYRKITEVNGLEVKFSPTVSKSFTEIEFIIAQIVDHQITESVSTDLTSFTNDDGDCMVESINQVGSSYVWNASIDSANIPDGPITIYVTAIDKAGNLSYGTVDTFVCNNRPRIAKVLLGTDLNGDGKYTFTSNEEIITSISNDKTADKRAFGEFSYYSALDANGRSQSEVEINSGDFKVISGLLIIPEFVGGNNSLGYIINSSTTDYGNKATGSVTELTSKNSLSSVLLNGGSFDINSHISDFGLINVASTLIDGDGAKKFGVTFWDKTEETEQGSTSQWSFLKIPVTLKTKDGTPPEYALINPFYWNSETDNSVYQGAEDGKGIKGHIELESDLSDAIKTSFGADDPKVSGQIILRGCVYDDVRLSTIGLSFTDILDKTTVLTYTNGSWVSNADNTKVISAKGTDEYVSQDGHKMNYEIVLDTATISNLAGLDKVTRVYATDWKTNIYSSTSTVQTSNTTKTSYYKVDVVPYVSSIKTDLSEYYRSAPSVYARTAHGHYPVRESEAFTIDGYNLGSSPIVTLNGTSLTNSKENNIGTIATSGNLEVSVNGVACLNNKNNNEVEYNKQPNKVNNNTLTDDLAMDVWQFKNAATPKNGAAEHVTMKINPSTGIPGFSYANSILYFNMPAYNSNQADNNWGGTDGVGDGPYSQIPVGMNYGGFSHNTFAFDKNGYSYGAAMCTDTQSAFASAYFQFFSRECPIKPSAMDQNMNYCNSANASRLDSSSVKVYSSDSNSSWVTNINRIQSPAMDTSVGSITYVYLAYYDDATKQIRFRWGTVGTDPHDIDGNRPTSSDGVLSDRPSNAYGLDDVVDGKYTAYAQSSKGDGGNRPSKVSDSYIKYSGSNNENIPIQIIASSGISNGVAAYATATIHKAGNYVSLSIVNKDTANPVAVVSWYDSSNRELCMAYNTSPITSNSWTTKVIDTEAGLNVKTAVDANGGIHFAYYKSTGSDLKYAYLSSYTSEPKVCTVDSFGAVGAKCTIDVVKDSSGNMIPYIGYQNNGYSGTPAAAKIAYRTDFTSTEIEGSDSSDYITGKWEISVVPTNSIPKDDQVNIGLRKNSNGEITNFNDGTNKWNSDSSISFTNSISAVGDATIVYANGTSNPVMAYGIDSGCIEMAQMK